MNRLILICALFAQTAFAANYCVGPAATGGGSGADWSHLKAWTDTPARGDVWYLINGSYAAKTLSTANASTTVITIKKATIANHTDITATGWSDGMAAQATFGLIQFGSSYWTFDGVTGDGASVSPADTNAANYGFLMTQSTTAFTMSVASVIMSDVTVRHVAAQATGGDVSTAFFYGYGGGGSYAFNNATFSHCLLDGWQNGFQTKGQTGLGWTNLLWQYNVCLNGYSSGNWHGEWINANERDLNGSTIRYNVFRGYSGTSGQTDTIVANNSSMDGIVIYGNVFDGLRVGAGGIGPNHGNFSNGLIYNNTFLNFTSDSGPWLGNIQAEGAPVSCIAYNNLIYNQKGSVIANWTSDYNSFYSPTTTPTEANQQLTTGNPFNNSAGMDYTVAANTTAGTALSSPYNVDALGHTRTTWTRGAFEYASVATQGTCNVQTINLR